MDGQDWWRTWCSEWWMERHCKEGLAENGWMMSKVGVTWIYTLSAGWLRIDYYGACCEGCIGHQRALSPWTDDDDDDDAVATWDRRCWRQTVCLRHYLIPQSASSCRWPAQLSSTPFFFDASAARSTIPFVNRRSSFFSRRRGHTLEHTTGGFPVIPFTSCLPPASEDIPLPQIISWCCMTGRQMAYCYFSHVKNFLIDYRYWTLTSDLVNLFSSASAHSRDEYLWQASLKSIHCVKRYHHHHQEALVPCALLPCLVHLPHSTVAMLDSDVSPPDLAAPKVLWSTRCPSQSDDRLPTSGEVRLHP